ncbi:bacteriocin immunity protein [Ligilactobacillus cholophilus]|uniref:bacteriocin immunity protein n=1 Tax=Ligilactobacillus cholophilus TaxID=3050131 RepID=UPI0025AF1E2D|nr:bacteriocin immunity protein [Ligilactobacillus cholophilus]
MLRWFSGGQERGNNAIDLLTKLAKVFDKNTQSYRIIIKFIKELESPNKPVPYILSTFNLEIAKAIQQDDINLNNTQAQLLKKIREISNIRYGGNI